jgi:pimeloyl-ACP methyl ester carboxylesterase
LVATIDSQPRQLRALATYRFDAARVSAVTMPTLLLIGEETTSPYFKWAINSLKAALPNATVLVLEGQQHNAMDSARRALADAIITFATGSFGEGK